MSASDKNKSACMWKQVSIGASVIGLSISLGLPAEAQSRRPNTQGMTCAQVQSLISQRGSVVLGTGPHTFDRYVANRNFCEAGEVLFRDFVKTKDNPKCFVERCDQFTPFRIDRQ